MFQLLNWEYRKPIIKKFVKNICNMLTKIFGGNSDIAGWFVVYFLHNLPYTLLMYRILFYKVENWVIGFFILTLVLHFFFKGCICFRLERELFQDKTWYGPYGLMEFVGIEVNTTNVIKFFNMWATFIVIVIGSKFINQNYFNSTL
mgnify:FL=1|tara:strand:+ start:711 stop:1148 length:438 start_codon:yes stop_codon:yes gene_type:complete